MLSRLLIRTLLLIGVAGLPSGADSANSASYRFRLTITIQRDGVAHSGSSVIELDTVSSGIMAGIDNIKRWETLAHGNAVFVDLGDGFNLILLQVSGSELGLQQTALLPSRVILGDDTTKKQGMRFDILSTVFAS